MRLNERLEALAQDYEEKARAIRLTMGALNGHLTARATHDFPAKLAKAAANGHEKPLHWTQRPENAAKLAALGRKNRKRGRKEHPSSPSRSKHYYRGSILKQRQASAKFLTQFSATPRWATSAMTGSLVRRGYLEKTTDGYVRTGKEYIVQPY